MHIITGINQKREDQVIAQLGRLKQAKVIDLCPIDQNLSFAEQKIKNKLLSTNHKINMISLWNAINGDIKMK